MFRASDIFGRKAGSVPKAKAPAAQKRLAEDGLTTSTWDSATGQMIEEELPAEVQELMGVKKKVKVASPDANAWVHEPVRSAPRVLGPSNVRTAPLVKKEEKPAIPSPVSDVDTSSPSVEFRGFSKVELNDRYYEKSDVTIHGQQTYWTADRQFFIYWQGDVSRWAVCDAASFFAVKRGQYPGWAYKGDHRPLSEASGWMEAWNGEWREPEIEVRFRSSSKNTPQWDDPAVQSTVALVEFHGFTMKEMNTRYHLRPTEIIQGQPSYWDNTGVYFIYWQAQMSRWAICDLKCLDAVKDGQCPGWAYRSDAGFLANACGWMESRNKQWAAAIVETQVISTCSKGLKVEIHGFSKQELNTQFTEKPDEQLQGKSSFWDPSGMYFIYWQSSMHRWAICDKISLPAVRKGLAPGWAYRTDSHHFARGSGWLEAWGREWKQTSVSCTVLEGTVVDVAPVIKPELGESGAAFSVDQYKMLVQKVYAQKNPSKLSDLPHLLEKYQGREHELYNQVCEKYEVDADEFAASLPEASQPAMTKEELGSKTEDDEYAMYEDVELGDLGSMEYAVNIQAVYEKYNPKKLQDLGRILQKYRNRERELYHDVCKKYDVHPTKFYYKRKNESQ